MTRKTRQKIVATTAELLERQGYHATGLNQIVAESATPRGSLYYYFPDGKEALAAEAVEQCMQALAEERERFLATVDEPIEAMVAMIMELSRQVEASGFAIGAPTAAAALEASNTNERIRLACAAGYRQLEAVYAAKLESAGITGERAERLAQTINALLEGGMIMMRTTKRPDILANIAVDVRLLLQRALA